LLLILVSFPYSPGMAQLAGFLARPGIRLRALPSGDRLALDVESEAVAARRQFRDEPPTGRGPVRSYARGRGSPIQRGRRDEGGSRSVRNAREANRGAAVRLLAAVGRLVRQAASGSASFVACGCSRGRIGLRGALCCSAWCSAWRLPSQSHRIPSVRGRTPARYSTLISRREPCASM
jgi:hypothetical protein